jgi:hypothetical protein
MEEVPDLDLAVLKNFRKELERSLYTLDQAIRESSRLKRRKRLLQVGSIVSMVREDLGLYMDGRL